MPHLHPRIAVRAHIVLVCMSAAPMAAAQDTARTPLQVLAPQAVWTDASHVRDIEARNDRVFAATSGGLVWWEWPQTRPHLEGTLQGLPSPDIRGVEVHPERQELLLGTARGWARGWPGRGWSVLTNHDTRGAELALLAPRDVWVMVQHRTLMAWRGARVESLPVPARGAIRALAHLPAWSHPWGAPSTAAAEPAPLLSPGLTCATDDGLWILRSLQPVRWLQLSQLDGLPSSSLLELAVDADKDHLWVGTRAGVARIDAHLQIVHWPLHPLLSQRTTSLFRGPSSHVYAGWWNGLFRIDTRRWNDKPAPPTDPTVEIMPGISEAVRSMTWGQTLWWTAGRSLRSFLGGLLQPPRHLSQASVQAAVTYGDHLWCGHPNGSLSRRPISSAASTPDEWQHFGEQQGLPGSVVRSLFVHDEILYVGTDRGLYRSTSLGTGSRFHAVDAVPAAPLRAQATWRASHVVGGAAGLWQSDGSGWRRISLWPGASEVQSLSVAAETLWVSAGSAGLAARIGERWWQPPATAGHTASFYGTLARTTGAVWCATPEGIVAVRGDELQLTPGPPIDVVYAHGNTLVAAGPEGLSVRVPGQAHHLLPLASVLPGSRVLSLTAGPGGGLLVGTDQGAVLFDDPQATDSPRHTPRARPTQPTLFGVLTRSGHALWRFELPDPSAQRLQLFDVRGRRVGTWRRQATSSTWRRVATRRSDVATGMFVGWLETPGRSPRRVRVLLRP